MTICISNEIQFLCPVAITTTCGMTLWAFSNNHLFGTAYKDIFKAMDKVRQWRIDPTKHFQSEVHNLMVLIERANETNDNTMPDKNILAVLYEEIWDYDIVQLHMEQVIVQCHDIAAAEKICIDFQRKTATIFRA